MKIGLNEQPWESMRTPDEIARDRDREAHLGGYCLGAPACWFCENDIDEAKARACVDAFRPLLKIVHVVGPLGSPTCPKCGGEGEKRGSWDDGPFWWQCEDCDHQWGHA